MESNLKDSFLGRMYFAFISVTWLSFLIILPIVVIQKPVTNLIGLAVMVMAFLLLCYSKRKFAFKREFITKTGASYLEGNDRNFYFLSYIGLYVGFILCFVTISFK